MVPLSFEQLVAMNYQLSFDDILLSQNSYNSFSSRYDRGLDPFVFDEGILPIVGSPMPSIISPDFSKVLESRLKRNAALPYVCFFDRFTDFEFQKACLSSYDLNKYYGFSCGLSLDEIWRTCDVAFDYGVSHVLIDIANANVPSLFKILDVVQELRKDITLWIGNVSTPDLYARLAYKADFIRVGIGGGSACTTRLATGVGAGNATITAQCAKIRDTLLLASDQFPAFIVLDGGIQQNGDICKALSCGADLVMLGKMLASTTESRAPFNSPHYKEYSGLASSQYNSKPSIEGAAGLIKVSGSLDSFLDTLEGNIRSCLTYTGLPAVTELIKANKLIVSSNVNKESLVSLVPG
jgi:IMP dehydrogenase